MSFWFWVTLLRMIFPSYIHLPEKLRMSLFLNSWVVFHCVNEPHFLYPFFCCGTSGLFPASSYNKQAVMNIEKHVPWVMVGHLFGICPRVVHLGLQVDLFPMFWGISTLNSREVVPASVPPAVEECSFFSTFSRTCAVIWGIDLSQFDWCKVQSQGCFDLN